MISIVITAYKEPRTIAKAIEQILKNKLKENFEILVLAPDKETLDEAAKCAKKSKKIKVIKDEGKGKPAALNIAFRKAKGRIIVFTDGDVYMSDKSLLHIVEKFKDLKVGVVSGRPISLNPRSKMLGFWSHLLADMADKTRRKCTKEKKSIVCTGYLYAVRKSAIDKMIIPGDILSDDAYISYIIENRGYKILYAAGAQVFVKYPSTFSDWIKQKARSTGGYTQLAQMGLEPKNPMRGFWQEVKEITTIFKYGKNLKEFAWTMMLALARIYLWLRIYYERRLKHKSFEKTWVRISTTK